jgi:hypothetical protein
MTEDDGRTGPHSFPANLATPPGELFGQHERHAARRARRPLLPRSARSFRRADAGYKLQVHATICCVAGHLTEPESRAALAAHLEAIGVREGAYHLFGAHIQDATVMDRRPEGWAVFYSERGDEYSLTVHDEEAGACADLLARVTREEHVFFDLVAGPAPTDEADKSFDAWLEQRGIARENLDPTDWKYDDVPWAAGPYWRRYFMRITAVRRLRQTY